MKMLVALLLAFFSAAPAPAAGREPWRWTDEERLAARFDPESIRERREEYQKQQRARNSNARAVSQTVNIIDGTRNPELLLPWELFQTLVLRALSDDSPAREPNRHRYAQLAPWIAGAPDFWSRLETAALPFTDAIERSRESGRIERESGIPPAPEEASDFCRSRLVALEAAREAFGRERFDEFLYTTLAPGRVTFTDGHDAPTPSRLLWIGRGCR
jgi:hypothetical protein